MSTPVIQSVSKALHVFNALFEDGFEGKTVDEVAHYTGIPGTSVWRLLKTLEAEGWAVEVPVGGRKHGRWRVSTKLAAIADTYEQHAIAQVQQLKRQFRQVTGRELSA